MNKTRNLWLGALSLLALTPAIAAQADHKMIQGRTGLPQVRDGKGNVWMENGTVRLNVSGNSLVTTQTFRLKYPGPPVETGPERLTIAVREEYFRETHDDEVTSSEARGFSGFTVMVDGKRVNTSTEPWDINNKRDTATRWRTWTMSFRPGQVRRLQIVSRAPLGQEENRKYFEFMSKDLRDWRGAPKRVEIRLTAPGKMESRMGGLSPKPNNVNVNAAQWVYTDERPRRDIYAQLPPGYGRMASRR
jgi:hypothetical protein